MKTDYLSSTKNKLPGWPVKMTPKQAIKSNLTTRAYPYTPEISALGYLELDPLTKYKFGQRVSGNFKKLMHELERASSMLSLQDNWNDEGALPIKKETFEKVKKFLYRVLEKSNNQESFLIPCISPCPDGSIDLFWKKNGSMLLLNVNDSKDPDIEFCCKDTGGLLIKGKFSSTKRPHILNGLINELQL